jgi:hypothetical protein
MSAKRVAGTLSAISGQLVIRYTRRIRCLVRREKALVRSGERPARERVRSTR